jgi:hypothetical protein
MVGGIIPLRRATSSRYDGRLGQESASYVICVCVIRNSTDTDAELQAAYRMRRKDDEFEEADLRSQQSTRRP